MKNYTKTTPEGTLDLLFGECAIMDEISENLAQVFKNRGYRKVSTPAIEFYNTFTSFAGEEMYKLIDNKGRLLVLRPDSTIPIARLTATRLASQPLPLRIYYNCNVYRMPKEQQGRLCEMPQTGIELIGGENDKNDIEAVELAVEGLCALGEENYRIELCHIGYFKAIIDSLNAEDCIKEQIRQSIEQKNYGAITELLAGYDGKAAQALLYLPRLFGGEEVFEKAYNLFDTPEATKALDSLKAIYHRLCKTQSDKNIIIDLGLVNQAEYYTGIIFRGYLKGLGEPVLSGGRYDNLHGEFGKELPAIGFAFNLDLAVKAIGEKNQHKPRPIRIALTKGRLEKRSIEMFEEMGIDCTPLKEKGRKLVLPIGDGEIEVVLAKAADVVTFVENGVCDLGIVGKDTIMEMGGSFFEVADLNFGKCRFALAAPEGVDFYEGYNSKKVGSKYINVATNFFAKKNMDVPVVKVEGSVELAPILGLADAIIDLVETGDTLRENGLKIIEEICPITARLIVNIASLKLRKGEIEPFITKIEKLIESKER